MGHRGGRCRGIFPNPDANTVIMGWETNNQAKRYALCMGLEIIISFKIYEALILGDSLLVIAQERRKVVREEAIVGHLQQQIIGNLKLIRDFNLLHILRHNNQVAT